MRVSQTTQQSIEKCPQTWPVPRACMADLRENQMHIPWLTKGTPFGTTKIMHLNDARMRQSRHCSNLTIKRPLRTPRRSRNGTLTAQWPSLISSHQIWPMDPSPSWRWGVYPTGKSDGCIGRKKLHWFKVHIRLAAGSHGRGRVSNLPQTFRVHRRLSSTH